LGKKVVNKWGEGNNASVSELRGGGGGMRKYVEREKKLRKKN